MICMIGHKKDMWFAIVLEANRNQRYELHKIFYNEEKCLEYIKNEKK